MADPPPVLAVLVQKGPCKGETRRGRAGAAVRVGRVVKGNHLAVRDAGASQSHLSLEFLKPPASRWAVTDLGSSNGTLLNGVPLVPTVPAPLSHGDLIKIGESTVLAVSISADEGPAPAPAATRRSTRSATAATAAAAEEEEQAPRVTRRGGRKKAAAAEASEAEMEVKEVAAVPMRRGGRKRAAEPPCVETELKEVAAVPTCRGGRKKAADPPEVETEEEEEEAPVPRRGGRRKAAARATLPPQPTTRSTRSAARRGDAVGSGNDEVERTGRGRGPATRASARKATQPVPEADEEEEEVPVTREEVGNPPRTTGVKGGEEEHALEIETRDGTSNASEEVPVAGRGRTKSNRGGRRSPPRARARKADEAVFEAENEKEQEESDMADGRGSRGSPLRVMAVNDGGEEDKVATGDGKLHRTSKASIDDEKMAEVEEDVPLALKGTAIEGMVSAQLATANNGGMEEEKRRVLSSQGDNEVDDGLREKMLPESKPDGVGEVEEKEKMEAIGGNGEEGPVEERPLRSSLENMTLGEWFDRIEKCLVAKNEEDAEKMIAEAREKHRRFCEHLKTLKKS
ncbi:hypothetical protein HU200_047758 [Digitaria exilis]|uniref:FHA domain-containing protein n=1 Tax=Digitaria exilis TaxID=1010633 RepID=A0A835B2M3_9POAL|nr:hypothetical protein HU200_047758 [Digitaria exilis]CAB3493387.1 unnamed protein product [Digitaria exilis]